MAFRLAGSLVPYGGPVLRHEIIANTITITALDSVQATSGFVALGTTGALVFGHVIALETNTGVGLNTTGVAGAEIGTFVGTYLTASDNQTVGKVRAACDISKFTLYSGTPDATIGTTTGSNLIGYHTDIADEDDIDENTATTATAQYSIWGVDPTATARGIYSIFESEMLGV